MNPRRVELRLTPAQANNEAEILRICARKVKQLESKVKVVQVRKSIDSRKGKPKVVLLLDVYLGELPDPPEPLMAKVPKTISGQAVVVGAGPAGYFCALELLLCGIKPIVVERGKDTRARRYDLRAIMQFDTVNPHSNYCFGEGGAGTYSDGKLYTRSHKRGDIKKVLRLLVEHGAKPSILVDTHPHIGSNKLPYVVEAIRASILEHGGEIHFEQHVTDLLFENGQLLGVKTPAQEFRGDAVVLATGHSARDVYTMLMRQGLSLEEKTFALGVRVEHPQPLIDEIQYRQNPRDVDLPAASYRLAKEGVYSFCMCPGGLMVPAATAPGEVVVNGMSMSKRTSKWANSGIVTQVIEEDLAPFREEHGVFAGLEFQASVERKAFEANGEQSQKAPCQRLIDFLEGRVSQDLPRVSYVPGVVSVDLASVLPERITLALRHSFQLFGRSMKGFLSPEAVIVGVESRTSSPVRVPRVDKLLNHPDCQRLYPCGEGAGFAGGIVSAAMDGQRVAQAIASRVRP